MQIITKINKSMKKLISLLTRLCSPRVGSQKDNGSTRLRVDYDSFTCRLRVCPLKLVSVLAILLTIGVGNVWGADVNVSIATYASDNSWSNGTRYESVSIDANVTATASGSSTSNTGKYYSADDSWRFYAGESGTLTISTTSGTISSVTLTFTVKDNGKISYSNTALTSGTAQSVSGSSVTFSAGSTDGSRGKVFITAISVTYTPAGGASVATPTFSVAAGTYTSAQSVSISCATAGSTIYYTTDGTTPTSSSTEYSSAISISSSCTLKAIAKKGSDYSSVASASYTINIPYTVTFVTGTNNPTVDPVTEESKGEGIELPDGVTPDCSYDGWVFAGWAKTSITEQNTAPRLYMPGDDYSPDGDENMYAVYRKLTSGTSTATFTSSDLSNLTVIYSGKWWVHSATGVEFYIHSYGIYDSKFDIWKSWALIDAHTQIKQVVFTNADATTIDHIALNSAESSAGGSASISGTTTQTITCSGDVSQLYLYSPASSDSYFTAFTVTYYNAKYNSNPTCAACDADPTIGDASINGSVF